MAKHVFKRVFLDWILFLTNSFDLIFDKCDCEKYNFIHIVHNTKRIIVEIEVETPSHHKRRVREIIK